MTSQIKINDLGLLRYAKASIEGVSSDTYANAFPADEFVCFGEYRKNKEPWWVVVLHSFEKNHDCVLELSFNREGLFSYNLFKRIGCVVADYLFNQANLLRCTTYIRASNHKSIRLAVAMGFVLEGIKRKGFITPKVEDMHILGLIKEECVWLSGR